jgi:hypothetical protein
MKVGSNSSLNEIRALFQGKLEGQPIEFSARWNSTLLKNAARRSGLTKN